MSAEMRDLRDRVLIPALIEEYGQDRETWAALGSANRIAAAILKHLGSDA